MDDAWIGELAASPWLIPALFALVVGDAFLVVLPSETAVVALGALWATEGLPPAGHRPGRCRRRDDRRRAVLPDRPAHRARRVALATRRPGRRGDRAGAGHRRTAVLVFTARYVPFARIAVNLAAGAGRVPLRRYLPLSLAAGIAWAAYNVAVGSIIGSAFVDAPLLAVAVSMAVAIVLGIVVDRAVAGLDARRTTSPDDEPDATLPPARR
jgi:membrane-associated protein